jgi:hypothetical protein
MGNWTIVVHGTGCHHNKDYPTDANLMFMDFVGALKQAGHTLQGAAFTYGGREVLANPAQQG